MSTHHNVTNGNLLRLSIATTGVPLNLFRSVTYHKCLDRQTEDMGRASLGSGLTIERLGPGKNVKSAQGIGSIPLGKPG